MTSRAQSNRHGFTLLELQVTLAILAIGLLGIAALLALQGRQMRRVEAWCKGNPTYYLVSHTSAQMRRLGAPAEMVGQPGQAPWNPPVTGQAQYTVAVSSLNRQLGSEVTSAGVILQPTSQP